MLQVNKIDVYYGDVQVLRNIQFEIHKGELVSIIGSNGAGKTTLINTISGILRPRNGEIYFLGKKISALPPHLIVREGVVQVPEGRLLFPEMTVRENLEMGGYLSNNDDIQKRIDLVFELFPILRDRERQIAGTMSGGEQQMLAIGRSLMSGPKLLMFDEPSLGLAPLIVQQIFEMIQRINKELGITVLLVEQNVQHACQISDRALVIENGELVLEGKANELLQNDHVRRAYLGL
jgi:branched-chain amino acid transport system ATP-binding protein